jgi:type I restriction enzyme S subunit
MSEWIETSVAELAKHEPNAAQIGPFGSKIKAENYVSEGVPYLRGANVNTSERFNDDDFVFLNPDFCVGLKQFFCKPKDIVLVHRGTIGKFGLIPPNPRYPRYVLGNSMLKLTCDPAKADADFVYYWFCSPEGQEFILSRVAQTGVPAIASPLRTLRECKIPLPPLGEQRAIAQVLEALDDKIELNRRLNRTLEEMAAALFRSWFADFDPVVAKAAGRQPVHLRPELAALFPAHWQDSPLGPIPNGWEVKTIENLARYVNGRAFTKGASGTGRMVIRIAELNSGPGGSTVYSDITAAPENVSQPGDLLFAWSGSLDVYRWYRDEAIINQHIFKVICEEYPQWFVHQALREAMPFFKDTAADKATTMGHIKREHLSEAFLALPPKDLLDAADKIFQPLYAKQLANERESLTLAALRDTLLPKLLSGELRVKQVEKLMEAKL